MTLREILEHIDELTVDERLTLIEAATRSLQSELQPLARAGSPVSRLRGLLRPDGPLPSDEEIRDEYTRHLIEKNSN